MSKFDLIDTGIFPIDIHFVQQQAELVEYVEHYGVNTECLPDNWCDDSPPFGGMVQSEGGDRFLVYLPKTEPDDVAVHECSHITDYCMMALGIPEGMESTETRAYLIQHIYKQITRYRNG